VKITLARLRRRGTEADPSTDSTPSPADEVKTTATATAAPAEPRTRFGAWLNRPMTSFHLIIAVAALLTTLGLIMVLSASGVRSYDDDGSAWTIFGRQVLWPCVCRSDSCAAWPSPASPRPSRCWCWC
jgi:cell division protein FtsW